MMQGHRYATVAVMWSNDDFPDVPSLYINVVMFLSNVL